MKSFSFRKIKSPLIITAATIGSGMFALPYVMTQAGWLTTLIYFVILGTVVVIAHAAYLQTLVAEGEHLRLLGLAKKYFGVGGFWFGFIGIVIGLLFSFIIFLILGANFVQLIAPSFSHLAALGVIWFLIVIPTLVSNRRASLLAATSTLCVAAIILIVFGASHPAAAFSIAPTVNWNNIFLPFGVVLFTLAGWTGVEPYYEEGEKRKENTKKKIWGLALGTIFAVVLYWLFAVGIISSAPQITANIATGLAAWPIWKRDLIALVGLFAITTVAMPISHEIRNALESDLRIRPAIARLLIILLPLIAVLAGVNNLILVISVAGGIFISMEYLTIIAVAKRAIHPSTVKRFLLNLIAIPFLAAMLYEIYTFIVK